MARIISIVNQKGGTGKSACTANLAVGLAQKNMKVLIVDADPQSDVSAGFGYRDCDESNETLTALMDTVMKDEDIPSDCYIRHQAEGIDIICSNIGLAGTEVQLVNAMSREYVLKQILYGIKDQYDAVIIDCMPSLGMITINALAASDEVLIPVEASYLPIKGLQQLLKTIGKVRKQINPKLQVGGILFTMVDAHTNDARNNMELLRNVYGSQIHIFDNYIPFSVRMKEAVREGQSIFSRYGHDRWALRTRLTCSIRLRISAGTHMRTENLAAFENLLFSAQSAIIGIYRILREESSHAKTATVPSNLWRTTGRYILSQRVREYRADPADAGRIRGHSTG